MCVDQNEIALPDFQCEELRKPKDTETCLIPLCNTTEDVESLDEDEDDTEEQDDHINVSSSTKDNNYNNDDNDDDNRIKKITITPYEHIDDIDLENDEESLESINDMSNTI